MTERLSFSVAQVRRFIRAAKEEGCRVVILPDRIELVEGQVTTAPEERQTQPVNSWEDV